MSQQIDTTLEALVNAEPALARVIAVKFDKDGGAKLRYHAFKLARLVQQETKHYYEERTALIEALGEGEPKKIPAASPRFAEFKAKHKELCDVPVTIVWGPLTLAMLEPYDEVTAADWLALGPLFSDEPPAEAHGA